VSRQRASGNSGHCVCACSDMVALRAADRAGSQPITNPS